MFVRISQRKLRTLSLSRLPRLSSRMLCFLCGGWRGSHLISASMSSSSAACTFFMLLIWRKTLSLFLHTGAASICQYRTKYGDQICKHSPLSAFCSSAFCCSAFYFSTFQRLAFSFWFSLFWYRPLFFELEKHTQRLDQVKGRGCLSWRCQLYWRRWQWTWSSWCLFLLKKIALRQLSWHS